MRQSDEYRRYQGAEARLEAKPELKREVTDFRRKVFDMQTSGRDIYDETDYLLKDFDRLTQDPIAADYLDAENAVCSMIRKVTNAITGEVIVSLPDEQ